MATLPLTVPYPQEPPMTLATSPIGFQNPQPHLPFSPQKEPNIAVIHETPKDKNDDNHHGQERFEAIGGNTVSHYDPDMIESINPSNNTFVYEGKTLPLPDIAMLRDGGNTSDRTLALYRQMEQCGVQTINSADSIENSRDKWRTARLLQAHNIPHPKTIQLHHDGLDEDRITSSFGTGPFIVKRPCDVQGKGVFLVKSIDQFDTDTYLAQLRRDEQPLIAQEYIAESHGMDLRLFVIDGHVHGCMKRICTDPNDFKANCSQSGRGEAYRLTPEVESLALDAAKALGLMVGGIDVLLGKQLYICEGNSSPGFKALDKALELNTGRTLLDFCRHLHHQVNTLSFSA